MHGGMGGQPLISKLDLDLISGAEQQLQSPRSTVTPLSEKRLKFDRSHSADKESISGYSRGQGQQLQRSGSTQGRELRRQYSQEHPGGDHGDREGHPPDRGRPVERTRRRSVPDSEFLHGEELRHRDLQERRHSHRESDRSREPSVERRRERDDRGREWERHREGGRAPREPSSSRHRDERYREERRRDESYREDRDDHHRERRDSSGDRTTDTVIDRRSRDTSPGRQRDYDGDVRHERQPRPRLPSGSKDRERGHVTGNLGVLSGSCFETFGNSGSVPFKRTEDKSGNSSSNRDEVAHSGGGGSSSSGRNTMGGPGSVSSSHHRELDPIEHLRKNHLDPSSANSRSRGGRKKMDAVMRNDSLSSDQSESVRPPPPKPHKHKRGKKQRQRSLSSSDDEIRSTPECTSGDDQEIESESVSEKGNVIYLASLNVFFYIHIK